MTVPDAKVELGLQEALPHPILYSAVSYLAYNINQRYYGGRHYVWCTPFFRTKSDDLEYSVPRTSSPFDIYMTLSRAVYEGDDHEKKIELNKAGILRGALEMQNQRRITRQQQEAIANTVERSALVLFRPLIYVISSHRAGPFVREVDITQKANALSQEFIAADLPRSAFDAIELRGAL